MPLIDLTNSVHHSLDHFADASAFIDTTREPTVLDTGEGFSVHAEQDWDGGPAIDLSAYVTVEHNGERLEVIGHMTIDDRETAQAFADALLAPFAVEVGQ